MELVWSVGRNIDRIASTQCGLLDPECYLHLTVEQDEGLFELVTMRSGPPPGGTCMSITQNRPLVSFPATVMVYVAPTRPTWGAVSASA
jgi:hypothetical protein